MLKQVIILRKDLNMRKGKMVAQGAHASLGAFYETIYAHTTLKWYKEGQTKICVGVDSEVELMELVSQARDAQLPFYLVRDAGHTELEPNTVTALAIGPAPVDEINKITGNLKLL